MRRLAELTLHEALILSNFHIGLEHLRLALLDEGGRAVDVLTALGVCSLLGRVRVH